MTWDTVAAQGLVAIFGDPEECRSICPAWEFKVEELVLNDPDTVGDDVMLADGSFRSYGRKPTTTRYSLRGHIRSDRDRDGEELDGDLKSLIANIDDLRSSLRIGRATGTGLVPVAIELDGDPYVEMGVHVLRVRTSAWRPTRSALVVEVEVPGDGVVVA